MLSAAEKRAFAAIAARSPKTPEEVAARIAIAQGEYEAAREIALKRRAAQA